MRPGLRDLQQDFLQFLLDKPSTITQAIVSNEHASSVRRMGLYADAYKLRLKEAIETDYEQLNTYLGEDLFDQLMERYIQKVYSHHPSLRYYSQYLPDLLRDEAPWNEAPELHELAKIEKAFCDSFDAADCTPAAVEDLAAIDPGHWPELTVRFNKSVQLIPTRYNSFLIWQALSDGKEPPEVTEDSSTWLLWRRDLISQYLAVSTPEAEAFRIMQAGGSFSEMCESLLDHYDAQETPAQAVALLQGWLAEKMIEQINTD